MRIPENLQILKQSQRLCSALFADAAQRRLAAEGTQHFQIDEMRCVQQTLPLQPPCNVLSRWCAP